MPIYKNKGFEIVFFHNNVNQALYSSFFYSVLRNCQIRANLRQLIYKINYIKEQVPNTGESR